MHDSLFRQKGADRAHLDCQTDAVLARPLRLSVVVPCYNEEACIGEMYRRVSEAARNAVGDAYELVFVDDGSRDGTWSLMRDYGESDPHILALRLSRNHGHQLALSAGLDLSGGELILIIDADLQDPPELLTPMIERMTAEGADVVYAVRVKRNGESWSKRLTSKLFYRILSIASDGTPIPLDTGDFRLLSRRALDVLQMMPEQSRFIRGMVAWIGFKQVAFPYERDERFAGRTNYPFLKMLRLSLDAMTAFSSAPLRFASYAGLVSTLLAFIIFLYSLLGWLIGRTVPGWTSLIMIVLLMGAIQLIVLGMIGEYLGRLYNQAKNRPLYIVSDVVGASRVMPGLGVIARPATPVADGAE